MEHYLTNVLKETTENFPKGFGHWTALYRKGHAGVLAPFTKEERKFLRKMAKGFRCKMGLCYMNAQTIATRAMGDPDVKYIEGLVTVHGVPIDHAWVEYKGKVFDPTSYTKNFKLKQNWPEGEYYGMEVPKDLIWKNQLALGHYAPLTQWPSPFAEKLLLD